MITRLLTWLALGKPLCLPLDVDFDCFRNGMVGRTAVHRPVMSRSVVELPPRTVKAVAMSVAAIMLILYYYDVSNGLFRIMMAMRA